MRKVIIDTDTGSDDAAAILMAAASSDIEILGVTTLSGNIPIECAVNNALMSLEIAGSNAPVFRGAETPLIRPLVTATSVHGEDGLGDMDLVHPTKKPESMHAVDFILECAKKYPGELELIVLGPATNIALAIMKDRKTMKNIKHIYSMGTAGFGVGNCTPVAEFNVFVDAESYSVMLNSGIPLTIIGFDLCLGPTAFGKEEIEYMRNNNKQLKFVADCTTALLNYNIEQRGEYNIDLPDAVAMGVALWDDIVLEEVPAYCYCCTQEEPAYGQVIIYDVNTPFSVDINIPKQNAVVIKTIDSKKFKDKFIESLSKMS